jgi:transposase
MDRAYEGDATRELAEENGFEPVVPSNPKRKVPWEYDKEKYKRRNEVERLFCRAKQHRRIFTRYDKLDVIFMGFILLAFVIEFLKILC